MRRISAALLCSMLILVFTSCSNLTGTKEYDSSKINQSVPDANSEFAFNIYKKLNTEDKDKNIFISPLSISTALTMAYNGAETTTRDAMSKALGYKDIDRAVVNESYKNLIDYLKNIDKKIDLNISNSIWIRDGVKINDAFLTNNKNNFNAEVSALDFAKDSSVNTINKWISDATKGKIPKMLEPPIAKDSIMYLINAIYFKGEWSKQFKAKDTREQTFKSYDGKNQTIKMMSQKNKVEYNKGDNFKAVRLPYGNGKVSMYCVLPDEGIDINNFIQGMSIEKWNDIRKNFNEVDDVILQIPKFKLEYGIKNINDSLKSLGFGEAFSDKADFSGIRDDAYISNVLHKAIIEVNEEGSEAAAVTSIEIKATSAAQPVTFIADRPFMFVIADDESGTVLFMGKLLYVN